MKIRGKVLWCEHCTLCARLEGDPNSDFYRTKIVPTLACEGCGKASKKPKRNDLDDVVETILKDNDDIHVVVGPWTWQPAPEKSDGKRWYFSISVSKYGEWFALSIDDPSYEPAGKAGSALAAAMCDTVINITEVDTRSMLLTALIRRKPIVIHSFDDELEMAQFCETLWPGERIAKVREAIEREREQWAQERTSS